MYNQFNNPIYLVQLVTVAALCTVILLSINQNPPVSLQ